MRKLFLLCSITLGITFIGCKNNQGGGGSSSNSQDEIVIGEVGSLTGSEATFGISTKNGVDMAIEKVNSAGGLKGKKLRVVVLDDQGKPDEAATAITRLITQDKVVAVIGEVASSRSLAMAPIAQANKVPMVSPSSTNPKVTEVGDYIFRVCFIDPFQGSVLAKFSYKNLKSRKAAILKDIKNDYSMGLSQFYKQKYVEMGGQIVAEPSYSAGDIDFKAQLTTIKSAKPDFVYLPGYYTDVGLIVRQARELGITVPFGGGDGWDSDKLYEIGGKSLDGSYFSNHYSSDSKEPILRKFVEGYRTKYGSTPDALGAMGYDAANILFDAIKRSPDLQGDNIRKALAKTKKYVAVTGKITIDEKRNAKKSAVILKVEDGKQKYVATIEP